MSVSFRVYIDESGDEGFKFLDGEQGSSRWLVLSAVVVRAEHDNALITLAREVRELLQKPPKHALHFRNLRHEQRVPFARRIGEAPIRHVNVLIHKPSIREPEKFQQEKFSLYRYATRLLIERVSWLCRDHRHSQDQTGRAEIIFSNRSAMSYDDLRSYVQRLAGMPGVSVYWPCIDISRLKAVNHDQLAGLQIADAVATSAFYAVHKSVYGETEDRYLRLLVRNVYRYRGTVDGYGLKLWCSDEAEIRRLVALMSNE